MTKEEYTYEVSQLERAIAFNKKLKCHLVAADRERRLKKLTDEYNNQNK